MGYKVGDKVDRCCSYKYGNTVVRNGSEHNNSNTILGALAVIHLLLTM
jgi:hypothetical protein